MTNFFEFYNLTPAFLIDEGALKRQFYSKSKEYHPDFYTLESEEKQEEILRLSTLNNEAYKVLSDFHRRMYHILELHGQIKEEGKAQLPQAFLVEMMDINEAIMELQFDPDPTKKKQITDDITAFESESRKTIAASLENYQYQEPNPEDLVKIRDYYYQYRYLIRLTENLDKVD